MAMPTKKTTGVLLFAVLLLGGTAMWLAMPRNEPAIGDADATQRANDRDAVAAAATAAMRSHETAAPDATPTTTRDEAPNVARERAPTENQPILRVVLRGLHRDVPWTAPLRLEYVGLYDTNGAVHRDDVVPDAEGRAQFVLPTWWKRCRHGRITAENDRYRSSGHEWMSTPDVDTEIVIDVQVLAELAGRVLDARGEPANAIVTAFRFAAGRNFAVATTTPTRDGTWRMPTPPDGDLLVVAQPTGRGEFDVQFSSPPDSPRRRSPEPTSVISLPTSRRVTCRAGAVVAVPDLVLPEATTLRCTVLWSDGVPIQHASVKFVPRGGEILGIPDGTSVQVRDDGRLTTSAFARTDANGAVELPLLASTEGEVQLVAVPGLVLAGGNVVQPVTSTTLEFRLPRPVTLRATTNGTVVRGASFESQEWTGAMHLDSGACGFVPSRPLRVRAAEWSRCSAWFDITAADAGKTVDLELEKRRLEVSVVLEGRSVGTSERFEWEARDGSKGYDVLFPEAGRFRMFFEPGTYRLNIGTSGGIMLPIHTEFTVDRERVTLTLPVRYGACLIVDARDRSGTNVGGTCRVQNASGEDVTAEFVADRLDDRRRGQPGELLPGSPCHMDRTLPPGDYELLFDLPTVGVRRQRVTLREGERAEILVRP